MYDSKDKKNQKRSNKHYFEFFEQRISERLFLLTVNFFLTIDLQQIDEILVMKSILSRYTIIYKWLIADIIQVESLKFSSWKLKFSTKNVVLLIPYQLPFNSF